MIPAAERIDAVNIGLILLSAILAIIIPFELFLFSYAILGPLHYLTEISWLHDKGYYTKSKYDPVFLVLLSAALGFLFISIYYHLEIEIPDTLQSNITWICLLLAIIFASTKSIIYRVIGIFLIVVTIGISNFALPFVLLTIFLPTLIHVYVFTGLFMLYGALKSKSRTGLISVLVLVVCPILLITVFPDKTFFAVTDYGKQAYTGGDTDLGFQFLHMEMLRRLFDIHIVAKVGEDAKAIWLNTVFHTSKGIVIARIIAFAYTYHYLNWFSKTRIIQWHKVPKLRFILVLIGWLLSVGVYLVDFTLGLVWLYFLSFTHVALELPLNVTSVVGIYQNLKQRVTKRKLSGS